MVVESVQYSEHVKRSFVDFMMSVTWCKCSLLTYDLSAYGLEGHFLMYREFDRIYRSS